MTNLMRASTQWATRPHDERFPDLASLAEATRASRFRAKTAHGEMKRLDFQPSGVAGSIMVMDKEGKVPPMLPTHWAFGQLASQVGAPASYLRTLPAELAATCLNDGLSRRGDFEARLLFSDEADDTEPNPIPMLRASTSMQYGRIWNHDVVDGIIKVVDADSRWHNPLAYSRATGSPEPSGLYASDRDMFAFLIDGGSLLEAGPRAQLNRGFFAWNSEVGSATFGLMTFLFNVVCGNHIVWGATDVRELKIRHTSGGPQKFLTEALPLLRDYANSSAQGEEATIRRAIEYTVTSKPEERLTWFRTKGFTGSEARAAIAYAEKEEGQCATLWDVIQGLTASARDLAYIDARVDLEKRAGALLKLVA